MPKVPEAISQKRLTFGVCHCQHRLQSPGKPIGQDFSKIKMGGCKISVSMVDRSWSAPDDKKRDRWMLPWSQSYAIFHKQPNFKMHLRCYAECCTSTQHDTFRMTFFARAHMKRLCSYSLFQYATYTPQKILSVWKGPLLTWEDSVPLTSDDLPS